MDGFTLIEKLRKGEKYRALPILVLTARGRDDDEKAVMNAGANGFIRKPYEVKDLLAEVGKFSLFRNNSFFPNYTFKIISCAGLF